MELRSQGGPESLASPSPLPVDAVLLERVAEICRGADDDSIVVDAQHQEIDVDVLLAAVEEELDTDPDLALALTRRYIALTNTICLDRDIAAVANASPELLLRAYAAAAQLPVHSATVDDDLTFDVFAVSAFRTALAAS